MSLAQLFYLKETFRENLRRWRFRHRTPVLSFVEGPVPSNVEGSCVTRHSVLSPECSVLRPQFSALNPQSFQLEVLEPRVLLSATPTEALIQVDVPLEAAGVTVPHGSRPSLDIDLNGQADALTDGGSIPAAYGPILLRSTPF